MRQTLGHRAGTRALVVALLTAPFLLTACSGSPEVRSAAASPTLPAAVPAAAPAAAPAAGPPTEAVPASTPSATPTPTPTPMPSRASAPSRATTPAGTSDQPTSLAAKAEHDKTLIVIDQPSAPQQNSLAAAAQRARADRDQAPRRKIVITDDNLADYATGQLTVANPEPSSAAGAKAGDDPAAALARDEEHWRNGARELRLKLRRAWDESQALAEQAAGLRTRFYAEDDPYVRDAQIKPAWDRALDGQRQAELEVKAYHRELDEFLETGRRAGALPGWLREGIEHEPEGLDEEDREPEAAEGFDRHRPVEPERMENPSRPPSRR